MLERDDPQTELLHEIVLSVRAERRLIEHELTRRRTLLVLTAVLPFAGLGLVLAGDAYVGGALLSGALASGAATMPRRSMTKSEPWLRRLER